MFNFYHYIICRWQTVGQLSCGQISICTATRIKMWRNVFPFCLGGFLLNRSRSQSWSPLDIWKSSLLCMNEFMINLDFYNLGTDSLWADQSFYQFWWFIDWHWPGGWRRISSRYRDTEAGEWEQVNNHEDSVGDVINWSVSPAPPWAWAPPQQRTLEKCPLQKWARAQAGARGTSYRQSYGSMMHAAASIQQALQLPSAVMLWRQTRQLIC